MNAFLSLGRWLFAIPYAIFGLFHFLNTEAMADYVVPTYMPMKAVFVMLSGAGMIAASVSMLVGKYDKLAATLLACFLLLLVVMVHLPATMNAATQQNGMTQLLKDTALAGAAMMYAMNYARDRSIIG
jgi:putative oxidoreductase